MNKSPSCCHLSSSRGDGESPTGFILCLAPPESSPCGTINKRHDKKDAARPERNPQRPLGTINATGSCRGLPEGGRRWKIKKKRGGGQRLKGKGQAGPALREGRRCCFAPLVAVVPRSGVSALEPAAPPPRRRLRKEGAGRTRSSSGLGRDRHGQGAEGRSESLWRGNRSAACCLPRRAAAQRADILPACPAPRAQRVPALGAGAPPLPPPRRKAAGGRPGPFQKQQQRGRAFPQRGAILVPQEPGAMGERREP